MKGKIKDKEEVEYRLTMSSDEAIWLYALMAKPIKKFDCEYSESMRETFWATLNKAFKDKKG